MAIRNTVFEKRESHLVTCKSDPSNMQVDYCFFMRDQRKFFERQKPYLMKSVSPKINYLCVTLR